MPDEVVVGIVGMISFGRVDVMVAERRRGGRYAHGMGTAADGRAGTGFE
ncbi:MULTISPECIES: hypothetical protein [Parafrankia]|nr:MULTISPECIES: hypothetical protein [Parafrankia]